MDNTNYKQTSLEAAIAARDHAIAQVESNADPEWFNAALQVVFEICQTRSFFTTDDVWSRLELQKVEPPHEPRAMGAVMMKARSYKWCRSSGEYVVGTRPEAHSRPIARWRVRNNDPKWPSER